MLKYFFNVKIYKSLPSSQKIPQIPIKIETGLEVDWTTIKYMLHFFVEKTRNTIVKTQRN